MLFTNLKNCISLVNVDAVQHSLILKTPVKDCLDPRYFQVGTAVRVDHHDELIKYSFDNILGSLNVFLNFSQTSRSDMNLGVIRFDQISLLRTPHNDCFSFVFYQQSREFSIRTLLETESHERAAEFRGWFGLKHLPIFDALCAADGHETRRHTDMQDTVNPRVDFLYSRVLVVLQRVEFKEITNNVFHVNIDIITLVSSISRSTHSGIEPTTTTAAPTGAVHAATYFLSHVH